MNSGDASLAAALRTLPSARAPDDLWPALAARAARRRRTRRGVAIGVPIALAASLALVVILPLGAPQHAQSIAPGSTSAHVAGNTAPNQVTAATSAAVQLAAAREHSQQLQAWVQRLAANDGALSGVALVRVTRIEDHIGMVDLKLGAASDAASQTALWGQRAALLQRLALARLSPRLLAVQRPRSTSPSGRPNRLHD